MSIATPAQQLPTLGDAASGHISLQQEHDLGRLWLRQLRAHTNVLDDPLAVQFIENTIYRMVPYSEVQINDFEFVIVDQKELNAFAVRSEEHTSELQSRPHLVCRLLLEKQ